MKARLVNISGKDSLKLVIWLTSPATAWNSEPLGRPLATAPPGTALAMAGGVPPARLRSLAGALLALLSLGTGASGEHAWRRVLDLPGLGRTSAVAFDASGERLAVGDDAGVHLLGADGARLSGAAPLLRVTVELEPRALTGAANTPH